jgi:hypothetical protein
MIPHDLNKQCIVFLIFSQNFSISPFALRHTGIYESDLFCLDKRITCFFPSLNTTGKAPDVLKPHGDVLGCLTGSARFLGSGSVKNDLLIVG